MNRPDMIFFDYGQTLLSESEFDGVAGTRAVLRHCVRNPLNVTAEEVQAFADELNQEMGRFDQESRHKMMIEVHNHPFQRYLYEYFGMEAMVSPQELDAVFWDHSSPGVPTDGIEDLLRLLDTLNIRTAVISNIAYCGETLANRINRFLPGNKFEFIIASSDYVFRKPSPRIFQIALKKAGLTPERVWHCGDNIRCDIEGAHGCGITPVWYTGAIRKGPATPPVDCLEIGNWNEIVDYIAKTAVTL